MIRGLYASATGMTAETLRQEVISNNLANSASPGFKRQLAAFQSLAPVGGTYPPGPVPLEPGVQVAAVAKDLTPGTVTYSDNPLDAAIEGPGCFVVETPAGLYYTRDGSFRLGSGGRLETLDGNPVLGQAGQIVAGKGPVTIGDDGTVYAGGKPLDKLQIVEDPDATGLAPGTSHNPIANPRLMPGYHEGSNVSPVREMAAMIAGFRSYEANQRAIQLQDHTLEQAAGEVARV